MSMMGAHNTMRSFRRDESVIEHKLAPGTIRRILGYATRYRRLIIGFLLLLVVDSLLVVAQPLLFKRIVDDGITPGNAAVVTGTAILVALLAVVDAVVGLISRWESSQIGEGLISDLSSEV